MKNTIIFLLCFFSIGSIVDASYYSQDYDPDYLPYNFQDAVDVEFISCNSDLDNFHEIYNEFEDYWYSHSIGGTKDNYNFPIEVYMGDQRVNNYDSLKMEAESEFRDCIIEERELQEEEEAEKEEEERKKKKEEREVKRQAAIEEALTECDFDFFDLMSQSEKMATFDERDACSKKVSEVVDEPEPIPVVVEPILIPEPVVAPYVPSAPPVQVQQTNEDDATEETESVVEEEISTSTEATTTEEVIAVTQEELDRMVEEKLKDKLEENKPDPEPVPEPKPSFFKRVTNFLFGWMF